MEQKKKTDRSGSIQRMAPAFLMIGLMVILAIANKNFLSMQSIYNLLQLGSGKIAGVLPWSFVAFMLVEALMYVLMNNTKLGVYTYAMGGNGEYFSVFLLCGKGTSDQRCHVHE